MNIEQLLVNMLERQQLQAELLNQEISQLRKQVKTSLHLQQVHIHRLIANHQADIKVLRSAIAPHTPSPTPSAAGAGGGGEDEHPPSG